MGYDLHITRRKDWSDRGEQIIKKEEWSSLVEAEPDMVISGSAEADIPEDGKLVYESPLLAVWSGHSREKKVWFDYRDGNIVVKNPDEETIKKMLSIAIKLGSRVQGDDGEIYPLEVSPHKERPFLYEKTSPMEKAINWIKLKVAGPEEEKYKQ